MKRIVSSAFALAILCLTSHFNPTPAQTTTQTDQLSSFQRTDTTSSDLILRGVSDDGKRFVFESMGNLTGENSDLNQEIFLYDTDSQTLIQVTSTKDIPVDAADATKGVDTHVTNNSPLISGDGRYIVFTSNSGTLAGDNTDGNQEIFLAFLPPGATTATFTRVTDTKGQKEIFDNYTPTINRDGSVIAFVSTQNIPASNSTATVNNADLNSEIYLYRRGVSGNPFFQVTSKLDSEATKDNVGVTVLGFNAAPFLSGDGKVLTFVSGFDYAPASATVNNKDFNGEIFIYRVGDDANVVTQVTNTTSADVIASGTLVVNLLTLSARHLSNDGSLLVFESSGDLVSGKNADKTREVFLYNTVTKTFTQITDQKPANIPPTAADLARIDANFLPSINSAGTYLTFGSVLDLAPVTTTPATNNQAGNREIFRVNITNPASLLFRQMTFTQPSARFLDQRQNTPVSWINDSGNLITFHTSSNVTGGNSDTSFEIFQVLIRPVTSVNADTATVVNAASFDPTAAATGGPPTIARSATGAIFGTSLANSTAFTPSATLPYDLAGVSVTVAGVAARLVFVSPGQINFQFPPTIAAADSVAFTINNNGLLSNGTVKVADVAPAIYTASSLGSGPAAAQCLAVLTATDGTATSVYSSPPCEASTSADTPDRYLTIYGTGWRNAAAGGISVQVKQGTADPVTLTTSYVGIQPDFRLSGLDQINAVLPKDLVKGVLTLTVLSSSTVTSQASVTIEIK